jgi:hypothetical protein
MKVASLVFAGVLLGACAAQGEKESTSRQDQVQAVRDFIEVRDLEEPIEDHFLIYEGRKSFYLVDFDRRCWELSDNSNIVADERREHNKIRARFDTIRGCRIHRIYALTEAEAAELENLGETPGSRK